MHIVHSYPDGVSYGSVIGIFFDQELGGNGSNMFLEQLHGIFANGVSTVTDNVSVKGYLDSLNTD